MRRVLAALGCVLLGAASPLPDMKGPEVQQPTTGAVLNPYWRSINQNFGLADQSNAELPGARYNLLYTPSTCDGITASTGAMTSGSAVLTDASAKFRTGSPAAAAGRPISVNGAGATQSAKSVAIVTGGLGYKAMDTFTMSDGTVAEVLVAGKIAHTAAAAATTANLTATYSGTGFGATLTNSGAMAAFSVDGYSASAGDRILVKDQSTAAENGVYIVTTVGSGAANWVLTRAWDFYQTTASPPTKGVFPGAYFPVTNGTVNAGTTWTFTTLGAVTMGTTGLTFAQGSGGVVSLAHIITPLSTSSPSSGAGASPASTSGAGTGLTVTVSYQRDNLIASVLSVDSDTQLTLSAAASATVSGAIYGTGTDYSALIAAAQTYGAVSLPRGKCGHATALSVATDQTLLGQGTGATGRQTTLFWLGANNGTQFQIANGSVTSSVVAGNFVLDGLGSAARGAFFRGLASPGCHIFPIVATRQRVFGIGIDSYAAESQYCIFDKLEAYQTATPSTSADGIIVGLDGNVNHHTFNKINIQHANGRGLVFGATDSNDIAADAEQQIGGTGVGLALLGRAGPLNSRAVANNFKWQEAIGGLYSYGLESGFDLASQNNTARINRVSGMPNPSVDDSASLVCDSFSVAGDICGNPRKTAFTSKVVRDLSDYTLTTADYGLIRTNAGATQGIVWTLPPATGSGGGSCFRRQASFKVTIQAVGSDTIRLGSGLSSAAGGSINTTGSDPADSLICLIDNNVSVPGTQWMVDRGAGLWRTDAGGIMRFGFPLNASGGITASVQLPASTFANLPTCDATMEGAMYAVTNSNTATFNAAIAGGGANHVIAYCNATAWVAH